MLAGGAGTLARQPGLLGLLLAATRQKFRDPHYKTGRPAGVTAHPMVPRSSSGCRHHGG